MELNMTPSHYGELGGGGKFKKPAARKTPSTPYDRPPPPLNRPGRTGWLSKLVDPAYRIISGSATRILPSFMSNAITSTPPPPPLEQIHDEEGPATMQDVGNDEKCTSSHIVSRSIKGKERDPNMGKLTGISEVEKLEEERLQNSCDNAEISRIEQLVQGKTFSRDEIMRLTEILNSRVIDEQENKTSRTAEGDNGRFHFTHETPRRRNDRKQDETDSAMPGTSTPLPQTNVKDEVGASPIDIARAYMGSRRLEKGFDSYGLLSKGQQAPQTWFLQPPSPKSSTCWPAAMVQDQHGCRTPQNQRGCGLIDFPRTPYSRTFLPESRDRTQSQVDKRWDLSAKPFQHSQPSIYSQEKTRTDLPHLNYGSVGPIRRIRNRFGSETRPKRSIFMNSTNASSPLGKDGASKVFLPSVRKNFEVGQSSGVEKYQSVEHRVGRAEEAMPLISSSNETVRKILEQLDRHKPTPAEKAAELKLASEWKKYPRNEISDATPNGKIRSSHLGEFGVRNNNGIEATKSSKKGDIGTIDHVEISQEQSTREADIAVDAGPKAASSKAGISATSTETYKMPTFTFRGADSEVKSSFSGSHIPSWLQDSVGTDNGQKYRSATPHWPSRNQSNGQKATTLSNSMGFELQRNAPGQACGGKPNLPSISVKKPNSRNATFPGNGFGFTFPVPASSGGALSEPPTPSIMPSSSASVISQPVDASTNPVYSFGTEKLAQRLVFSFPSTSNASVLVDASDVKFSFGGDRKSRLSFSSVGKATC